MKSCVIASILFSAGALASPVMNYAGHQHVNNFKRDVVTNVVQATKVLYQNEVVYVDGDGKPYSTGLEPASTTVKLSQSEPTDGGGDGEQQKQAPTSTTAAASSPAAQTTSQQDDGQQKDPQQIQSQAQESQQQINSQQEAKNSQQAAKNNQQQPQPTQSSSPETSSKPSQPQSSASSSSSSGSGSDSGSDSGSNSGSGEKMSGQATYYTPGLGACGKTSGDSDKIAALNKDQFYDGDSKSNGNGNCGRKAKVTRGGKSVTVTIVDSCPGCKKGDLDLSPSAFKELADESEGRVEINWQWAD